MTTQLLWANGSQIKHHHPSFAPLPTTSYLGPKGGCDRPLRGWVRPVVSLLVALATTGATAGTAGGRLLSEEGNHLLTASRRVFVGAVERVESRWVDGGRNIATMYRFRVMRWIRGDGGDFVELLEYGGQIGSVRMSLTHGVSYRRTGEYLIFARPDGYGNWRTAGGALGSLPVHRDGRDNEHVRLYQTHPLAPLLGVTSLLVDMDTAAERLKSLLGEKGADDGSFE